MALETDYNGEILLWCWQPMPEFGNRLGFVTYKLPTDTKPLEALINAGEVQVPQIGQPAMRDLRWDVANAVPADAAEEKANEASVTVKAKKKSEPKKSAAKA